MQISDLPDELQFLCRILAVHLMLDPGIAYSPLLGNWFTRLRSNCHLQELSLHLSMELP